MIDGIKSEPLRRAIELHIQNWNALVPRRYIYHAETPTHFVFRHPTKGFRRISKKRLMVS